MNCSFCGVKISDKLGFDTLFKTKEKFRLCAECKEHLDINILEVGAGSGVISIILKKKFPNANITSFDISEKAIYVACENAKKHSVEINFVQKDYLNYQFVDEKYDVIISNPPYIGMDERGEISDSVKKFEPNVALFSPIEDTLIFYRKISQDARQILNKNGLIFLEINQKLGQETLSLYGGFQAKLIQDLSGNDRVIIWEYK